MQYIGYQNERSRRPKYHRAKNGKPLCGREMTSQHYLREGLPKDYLLCDDCNQRHTGLEHIDTDWSQEELAAENMRRIKRYRDGQGHGKDSR